MVKYRISNVFEESEAIVSLDVNDPNTYADIVIEGDTALVDDVKQFLSTASGAFGHLIGKRTTAIDLSYAFSTEDGALYHPELIEGKKLVKSYDPGIPEDSFT